MDVRSAHAENKQGSPRWWTVLDGLGIRASWRHSILELHYWQVQLINWPDVFAFAYLP